MKLGVARIFCRRLFMTLFRLSKFSIHRARYLIGTRLCPFMEVVPDCRPHRSNLTSIYLD